MPVELLAVVTTAAIYTERSFQEDPGVSIWTLMPVNVYELILESVSFKIDWPNGISFYKLITCLSVNGASANLNCVIGTLSKLIISSPVVISYIFILNPD
jgi:hypothetical protein